MAGTRIDLKKNLPGTTIRLAPELNARSKENAKAKGISLNALLIGLLENHLESENVFGRPLDASPRDRTDLNLKEIQQIVANSVAKHLRADPSWLLQAKLDVWARQYEASLGASQSEISSGVHQYEASLVGERSDHWRSEKQAIAEGHASFLVRRILWHLRNNKRIRLVIDSGTQTLAYVKVLVTELRKRLPDESSLLRELVLISNNIAAAETYMRASRGDKFIVPGSQKPVVLSDLIRYQVLPGTVQTEYAAVVGDDTVRALEAEKERLQGKETVFIALLSGNWIRMSGSIPIPLVHNKDQKSIKEKIISICAEKEGEIYLPAPLPKVFYGKSVDEINQGLNDGLPESDRRLYQEVQIPDECKRRIRLVSMCRSRGHILAQHSLLITAACGTTCLSSDDELPVDAKFENLPHFLYQFDQQADLSMEAQIENDFPHKYPHLDRRREFREKFFSVGL